MGAPNPESFLPLPALSYYILLALGEGEAHGWAIIRRAEALTEGRTQPSSGSLYLAMARLEDSGLIREGAAPSPGEDARRRYYCMTPLGRAVAAAESRRLARLVRHAQAWNLMGRTP